MVFQSVYLFADTIENNIKFGCPDATHEQVVESAKKACCHDFISALPDGYDTVIGECGGTLSGGEKQRISIARAMLKDAPITVSYTHLPRKRLAACFKTPAHNFSMWTQPAKSHSGVKISASRSKVFGND